MRPEADQVLRTLSGQLLSEIAPRISVSYGKSSVEVMAVLLLDAAEEYDRAVESRFEENRAMRKIFRDAAVDLPDGPLRDRLAEEGGGEDACLRVSALNEANDRLRKVLIELHAFVEERDDEWARRVNREIWRELRASAIRRAFSFVAI
jgi:hypothetical protein